MIVKTQLFLNGRYVYKGSCNLAEPPPEGVDDEEWNRWQICEMFRQALRNIDREDKYRLDISKRPEPGEGLPHGTEESEEGESQADSGDLTSEGEEDPA